MLTFKLEKQIAAPHVCGVDEAGRGPWAGPVVAAAVMFSVRRLPKELKQLNDSKKLTREHRHDLFEPICTISQFGIGIASVEEIETFNIWGATMLAMRRAIEAMPITPHHALVDGKTHPRPFPCPTQPVIGGDGISPSIAAASILAKVTRDRMMHDLAQHYPQYGFERHVGYGTREHQHALATHGICPLHRRGFAPIRALLERAA